MTRRERFERTMKRLPVDRVPLDFAGTGLTMVSHEEYYGRLAGSLGLPLAGDVKEAVLSALDVDFRCVGRVLQPVNSRCRRGETFYVDSWGVKRAWTGQYYDIVESPLRDSTLEELEQYEMPGLGDIDPQVFTALHAQARELCEHTDYVVVGSHPVYGVMEMGCWLCGYDDFLYRMLAEPEYVRRFYEKVYDYQMRVSEKYYALLGPYLHVTTSGDDFGSQTGPFLSPELFHEQIAPFMKERITLTKSLTGAYFFHHTCGSVYRLMEELIGCGIDILNPIQPTACEMEPERLNRDFGDRIAFWGGIDEQGILTQGSADDVRSAVRRVLGAMEGAAYIAAPSHNIQGDVPPENVTAMCRAVREYQPGIK